jgi:16S rRNA (guanine527-N7)-methyltransferase
METGSEEWKDMIIKGAGSFGVKIDSVKAGLFSIHALELLKWNLKTNLTAITDPFEVAVKHFIDSLAPARMIPSGSSVLDIGSGGGFPGIPLKVALPSISVSLVDSSRKKVSFLRHVIRNLGLCGIDAFHERAEDLTGKKERFDVVVCRAFSSIDKFISLAFPLLKENGIMIAMKGKRYSDDAGNDVALREKKTAEGIRCDTEVIKYSLPYDGSERALIVVKPQIVDRRS